MESVKRFLFRYQGGRTESRRFNLEVAEVGVIHRKEVRRVRRAYLRNRGEIELIAVRTEAMSRKGR